jgi:uncharacterized membrane protein YhhN
MNIWLLSFGILISGILAVWTGYRHSQGGFYVFKPLTMIFIILIPLQGGGLSLYKSLIMTGLLFSLLGDIFLMLPGDRFLAGLAAFLIAHLFYISGFLVDQGMPVFWPILPVFSLAVLVGWYIQEGMGEMKIPAFAYMGVISVLLWLAWSRWINEGQMDHLLAFCGAALFMISDLILGINKFKRRFKAARLLDLSAYYVGQWLIALSAIGLNRLGL